MATSAALNAFRIVYADPEKEMANSQFYSIQSQYALRWAFYQNSIFDRSYNDWLGLARNYGLYNKIRSLKNPVGATVDFYSQMVYPGGLSPDGKRLPDDMPTAMPFPDDTDEELMLAIAQIWQWSNWSSGKSIHVKKCAALGDNLIEVVDDTERGKVYYREVWPGYVTDIELDPQGNVKAYTLEHQATDPGTGKSYKYKKTVDKLGITEYRDEQVTFQTDNPYGFVPAYWFKHSDVGGTHGQPAFRSLTALMELNAKLSQVSDHVGKVIAAPAILGNVARPSDITRLIDSANSAARVKNSSNDYSVAAPDSDREGLQLLTAPGPVDIKSLSGNLNIKDALEFIRMIDEEVDARNPEITYWDKLREMTQLTGPAADRLSGDVKGRVLDAQANYDRGNINLAAMAITIAGMRFSEGRDGWRNRTRQQAKFAPFDIRSFERGELDFSFAPRPLLMPTQLEKAQEKLAYWTGINSEIGAGVPLEVALEDDGWGPEKLARLDQANQNELARIRTAQQLSAQDVIPALPEGRQQ